MFKIILSKSKNKFICFISSMFIMLMPNLVSADTVNILGLFPFSGPYADSGKLLD